MASNDDKIKQFCEVTGSDQQRAQFFLESAGWDINAASEAFFTSGGGEENMIAAEGAAAIEALDTGPRVQPSAGRGLRSSDEDDDDDDADDEMLGPGNPFSALSSIRGRGSHAAFKGSSARPTAPPAAAANRGGARIATLSSLRGNPDSAHRGHGHDADGGSDDDDEGRQGFYAGSGQQIMGPKTSGDPGKLVGQMFKAARAGGAQVVDPSAVAAASSRGPNAFGGQGVRLGANEQEAGRLVTERPQEGARVGGSEPHVFVLNMWRNGFSLDDGPLRAFDDPANQTFLTAVMRGEIPEELREQAGGSSGRNAVHVNMEDHRHEEFKAKPAPKMQAFSGQGHMLGSPAPAVMNSSSSAQPAKSSPSVAVTDNAESARYIENARQAVQINENEPTTNIQIRLPDNSRVQGRFNQNLHNVGDVRQFIAAARPDIGARQFALMQSFPRVELADESKSLKDAGLVNASIAVQFK